jgi:hypothetical protein
VLGRVGQRLGHDVKRADFDRVGQVLVNRKLEGDRDGRAAGQCLERGTDSALGQDRRMNPA